MVAANVELTHQRLRTLENRTSMMAKAIMPVLYVLKCRIADTDQRLTSQYRMMQMAHHRYNLPFRQTYKMLTIHHFALLQKNSLTIQVGMLRYSKLKFWIFNSSHFGSKGTWKLLQMIWKSQHQTANQYSLMSTSVMVIH